MAINSNGNEVNDSTELAALVVPSDIVPGTKVWNADVGTYFTYTISTDALVPDEVVAVAGITGARWIVDGASVTGIAAGTGITVTGPASGVYTVASSRVQQTTTLVAAAAQITVSGLDGNTDGSYRIDWRITEGASGSGAISIRPNNLATNQQVYGQYIYTASGFLDYPLLEMSSGDGTGKVSVGVIYVRAKAGFPRMFTLNTISDATGGKVAKFMNGVWTDTTTNITEFRLNAATALGFAIGSSMTVTPLG